MARIQGSRVLLASVFVLMTLGCGEGAQEDAARSSAPISLWSTCDFEAGAGAGYQEPRVAPVQHAELRIIAIHEATSTLGGARASGEAAVHMERSVPTVLFLSAFEATTWTVTVEPGSKLTKVIVDGAAAHRVKAPAGVAVENYSGPASLVACGYADEGECRMGDVISAAERLSGLSMSGFVGCRYGNEFGLYDAE